MGRGKKILKITGEGIEIHGTLADIKKGMEYFFQRLERINFDGNNISATALKAWIHWRSQKK